MLGRNRSYIPNGSNLNSGLRTGGVGPGGGLAPTPMPTTGLSLTRPSLLSSNLNQPSAGGLMGRQMGPGSQSPYTPGGSSALVSGNSYNPSNSLHQQQRGVSAHQPPVPPQQQQPQQQQQQSLMGMNPPGLLPIRHTAPNNGPNMSYGQRPLMMNQQQTSIMGSRPPLGSQNGPGLLPLQRPGLNSAPGLLNNPNRLGNNQQRNDWDRSMNSYNAPAANGLMGSMMSRNSLTSAPNTPYGFTPNQNVGNGLIDQPPQATNPLNPYANQTVPGGAYQHGQSSFSNSTSNAPGAGILQSSSHLPHGHHLQQQQQSHLMGGLNANPAGAQLPLPLVPTAQQQHAHHLNDPYYRQNSQTGSAAGQMLGHVPLAQAAAAHHPQLVSKISDLEFQEALEKNRIISSTAISRAVQDASTGNIFNHFINSSF